jgi:putative DNA primase/helicase
MELHEHRREDLLSKICNTTYTPEALCPTWDEHTQVVFGGDVALVTSMQEFLGYGLFDGNPDAVFGVFFGSGRNGKSVTYEIIQRILGTYAVSINPSCLMDGGGNAGSDRMKMIKARLIVASEPGDSAKGRCTLDTGFIKSCSGGDTLSARHLYCESINFKVEGLTLLITNVLPQIRDPSVAIWDRIWCVPFNHYFKKEERDKDIIEKLLSESSGILNWLIEGYIRYTKTGLNQCKSISSQTADYQSSEDLFTQFIIDANLVKSPALEIKATRFYELYKLWHTDHYPGTSPKSLQAFGRQMSVRFQKVERNTGAYYIGIGEGGQTHVS